MLVNKITFCEVRQQNAKMASCENHMRPSRSNSRITIPLKCSCSLHDSNGFTRGAQASNDVSRTSIDFCRVSYPYAQSIQQMYCCDSIRASSNLHVCLYLQRSSSDDCARFLAVVLSCISFAFLQTVWLFWLLQIRANVHRSVAWENMTNFFLPTFPCGSMTFLPILIVSR